MNFDKSHELPYVYTWSSFLTIVKVMAVVTVVTLLTIVTIVTAWILKKNTKLVTEVTGVTFMTV